MKCILNRIGFLLNPPQWQKKLSSCRKEKFQRGWSGSSPRPESSFKPNFKFNLVNLSWILNVIESINPIYKEFFYSNSYFKLKEFTEGTESC